MTEDQVAQLSALGRDMEHVIKAVDEIKRGLGNLATKEEVAAMVSRADHTALTYRVETLERRVDDQSPTSWISTITRVAVMITAVTAAFGVISLIFLKLSKL